MSFVNYEEVNKIIKEVENVFDVNDLNIDEKEFVLKQLALRTKKATEKQRMSDLVGGALTGGFLKSTMKKLRKSDEEGQEED